MRNEARSGRLLELITMATVLAVGALLGAGCSAVQSTGRGKAAVRPDPKTAGLVGHPVLCGRRWVDLSQPVRAIAEDLQARRVMYAAEELSDCSGMFHRVLRAFARTCPGYSLPEPHTARSTRDLARWYAARGLFTLVTDEIGQADLIKPGGVMFYGRSNKVYRRPTLAAVLAEIEHLGVVVAVERDGAGKLLSYRLFHGRSPGKPAAITGYHRRQPARAKHRPFGNWSQQWVGFAPLAASSMMKRGAWPGSP